ncbi:MAG: hypothetical protein KGJ60_03580 [Verrucomicrobiota bacterium]|nr:hypothetical protein [Verrucomicrobiota bacterium]
MPSLAALHLSGVNTNGGAKRKINLTHRVRLDMFGIVNRNLNLGLLLNALLLLRGAAVGF